MNTIKRLVIPVILILGISLLTKLYLQFTAQEGIIQGFYIFINSALYYLLGLNLNKEKNQKASLRKLISILVGFSLLLLELNCLRSDSVVPMLSKMLSWVGLTGSYYSLLYLFCGFLYYD
jgi:hypothetical protein